MHVLIPHFHTFSPIFIDNITMSHVEALSQLLNTGLTTFIDTLVMCCGGGSGSNSNSSYDDDKA